MRRTILLLATMALTLLVTSGVALAVNKIGTDGPDTLRGTNGNDNLAGRGDKNLVGGPDNDAVIGGKGSDIIVGGEGNDLLFECCLREFSKDTLFGGSGNDVIDVWHKPAAVKDVCSCMRLR